MVAEAQDTGEVEEHEEEELPQGWTWVAIGTITDPVQKVDPTLTPTHEFIYLDISSIDNSRNMITEPKHYKGADAPSRARQLVHFGDTLFSTVRTYLRNIAQVPEIYNQQIASTGFCVLRGKQQVAPKYLFYYCLTDDFITAVSKFQRGVSYPAIRDDDVRKQNIPLPPLPEQHRIVAKIEELFTQLGAGVAALKRVKANLRRYRAAVLKATCEGRLLPQDPGDESASQLLERILVERRARWETGLRAKGKDSVKVKYEEPSQPDVEGLGELPDGWVWASLAILSEASGGYSFRSDDYESQGYQIVKMGNVRMGRLDLANRPTYIAGNKVNTEILHKCSLEVDDLIITLTGTWKKRDYGYVALVKQERNLLLNQRLVRLRFHDPLDVRYFLIALQGEDYRDRFFSRETGNVGQGNVSIRSVTEEVISVPPLAEQHRIVAEVERRLSVVQEVEETVEANLKRAERLRQAVLRRAFRGELVAQDAGDGGCLGLTLDKIKSPKDHRT